MSGNSTGIKDPENLSADPKKFAFDYSYWSHDGFTEQADGYLQANTSKYADQVCILQSLSELFVFKSLQSLSII